MIRMFVYIIAVVFVTLAVLKTAEAVERNLTIGFAYTNDADYFRVYERTAGGKEVLADTADGVTREIQFTKDINEDCHTFFMTAWTGGKESLPSNAISWCPEGTLPDHVSRPNTITGEFILKVDGVIIQTP